KVQISDHNIAQRSIPPTSIKRHSLKRSLRRNNKKASGAIEQSRPSSKQRPSSTKLRNTTKTTTSSTAGTARYPTNHFNNATKKDRPKRLSILCPTRI